MRWPFQIQIWVHESINTLDTGTSYSIGSDSSDRWFLYIYPTFSPDLLNLDYQYQEIDDITIEILMTKLNREKMEVFYTRENQKEGIEGGELLL